MTDIDAKAREAQTRPGRIVVIDDDPAVLAALAFSFEIDGFEVETLENARSAIGADLATAACLVVDYHLPGRDGLELVERLREHGIRTPAILITSHPTPATRAKAAALGMPVVEKPLLTDELARVVTSMTGRGPGGAWLDGERALPPPPGPPYRQPPRRSR